MDIVVVNVGLEFKFPFVKPSFIIRDSLPLATQKWITMHRIAIYFYPYKLNTELEQKNFSSDSVFSRCKYV